MHIQCSIFTRVKHVLSDHINQDIFLAFHSGGCLLLHESRTESPRGRSFLCYFYAAISNHLSQSIAIPMSPERVVAYNRFNCNLFT